MKEDFTHVLWYGFVVSAIMVVMLLALSLREVLGETLEWRCDWPQAKAQNFALYRGETAQLAPSFYVNGREATNMTISTAWYQTNGMAEAWWELPGAVFAPSNDVGAAAYRFFVAATNDHGELVYRANGTLRMIDSPGFEPSRVAPPVRTLDFDYVEVVNEPWATLETVSNVVQEATSGIVMEESDPTVPAWAKVQEMPSVSAFTNDARYITSGDIPASWPHTAITDPPWLESYTESDPVWEAEKVKYATTNDLEEAVAGLVSQQDFEAEISTWFRSTNAWISVSNGVMRVWEVSSPTNILRYEWDMSLASATGRVAQLEGEMPAKKEDSRDWAGWTASGVSNSFGAVMLDMGATYFGSTNVVWSMSGGFAVLTSHALPVSASGNANQFRIGLDADDWFGFEISASYLINARPEAFSLDIVEQTVSIGTEYDESYLATPPHVYFASSLGETFTEVVDARLDWSHVSGGLSTVVVSDVTESQGFFILKKEMAGGPIMRSTMPFLPEGYRVENEGSYVGTFQPDSIITIEVNGTSYRIFAQEVQQ